MSSTATTFAAIKPEVDKAVTDLTTAWADYTQAKTGAATTASQTTTLQAAYSEKELVLRELQRQEDTLNQQYLDQRSNPAPTTLFARIGLGATQDWVLAFFFFGYGLMALSVLVAGAKMSAQPLRVMVFGALGATLIGFVLSLLIRYLG